ncbi:MAG: hypothetical protein ACRCU2_13085 [Planktothrix sp.]
MTTQESTTQETVQSEVTAKITDKSIKVTPEIKAVLDGIKDELGLSWNDLVAELITTYQQQKPSTLEFTSEEEKIIGEATQTGITRDELFKIGILSEAKKRASMANTFNLTDMSDEILFDPKGTQDGKSLKTVTGIGEERISRTVAAVMAINNATDDKDKKSCITQGLVFTLCGVNRNALNKYFAQFETMISDHNLKHDLDPNSNRKGNGYNWLAMLASFEIELGISPKTIGAIARFKDLGHK